MRLQYSYSVTPTPSLLLQGTQKEKLRTLKQMLVDDTEKGFLLSKQT